MVNKLIDFWTKNPVFIRRENFIFVWFGIILGIVIFLAVFTILVCSVYIGDSRYFDYFLHFFLWWPLSSIGGSIFFFHDFWFQLPTIIARIVFKRKNAWRRPGAVFYGGFVGSAILAVYLADHFGISFYYAADYIFLAIPFFHGLARLACLNFGCCYGKKCSPRFPVRAIYHHPLSEPIRHGSYAGEPKHATQLYEMLLCIGLSWFLLSLVGEVPEGRIFATYLVGYGVIRFVLEFVRDNTHEKTFRGVSIWQLLSLFFVLAGILLWWLLPDKPSLRLISRVDVSANFPVILLLSIWNGASIGTTLGLHFRTRNETL